MTSRVQLLILLVLTSSLCACSREDEEKTIPRYSTRGSVLYNDRPASGAHVTLHPMPLEKNTFRTVKPASLVDANGNFELKSLDTRDGARAGEYAVTIRWSGEQGGPGPDLL